MLVDLRWPSVTVLVSHTLILICSPLATFGRSNVRPLRQSGLLYARALLLKGRAPGQEVQITELIHSKALFCSTRKLITASSF